MIRKLYFLDLFKLSLSRGWIAHLRIFLTIGLAGLAIIEAVCMLILAGAELIRDEIQIYYEKRVIESAKKRRKETIDRLEKANEKNGIRKIEHGE